MNLPGRTGADGAVAWEVRAYPHEDQTFLSDAHTAIATCWESVNRGRLLLEDVLAQLRPTYPDCELSIQDDLAQFGRDITVIYAFRDGRAA